MDSQNRPYRHRNPGRGLWASPRLDTAAGRSELTAELLLHRLEHDEQLPPNASVLRAWLVSLPGVTLLTIIGLAGNCWAIPLSPGVDWRLGSVAALAAAGLYGPMWGVISAFLANLHTLVLWGQPYALVVFCCEALAVGLFTRRSRPVSLVLADALFWGLLGGPLVWVCNRYLIGLDNASALLVLLKQCANGIVNALLAALLLVVPLPVSLPRSLAVRRSASLHEISFVVLALAMVLPVLLFTAFDSHWDAVIGCQKGNVAVVGPVAQESRPSDGRPHGITYLRRNMAQEETLRNLALILVVTLIALPLARLASFRTSDSLGRLAQITGDIPQRLLANESIDWPHSAIEEVEALSDNFRITLQSLRHYFAQTQAQWQELRSTNEELQQCSLLAQAATRAKSEFLANMSHEIRTPITAILGFAEDLMHEPGDIRTSEQAAIIHRNGQHLLQVVNDILDLSKIESGRLRVEPEPYCVFSLVDELMALVRIRAEEKSLDLSAHYEGLIPETIHTDPTRLRQILLNLLANAIKFTPQGAVRLDVRMVRAQEPRLEFDVVDTGIGVCSEQAQTLFEPFAQGDGSTVRRFGGTGLGLTISRRLARLLRGDVVLVHSVLGGGSCFRASVATGPLEGIPCVARSSVGATGGAQACPVEAPIENQSLAGRRILLVEDGRDNQRLMSLVLHKAGAVLSIAENGQQALDAVLADPEGMFDVILMDIQMPVMDGYQATALLRERGYRRSIIALTAHAMADDREKCLQAGCDDYLSKPIDRGNLLELVARYAARDGAASWAVSPTS